MRSLTRKGETIIRELEILADGNQRRVDQALSCRAIGRQRTLLDVVDDMLHDCVEPADPAVRESWRQAARAALAEAKPARRGGRVGGR